MINPYKNINWDSVFYIPSCSHEHCNTIHQTADLPHPYNNQRTFDMLVDGGLRHIALSNYHPPIPSYPLEDYFDVPESVIGSPNAEFYAMPIPSFHMNGIGSTYSEQEPAPNAPWQLKMKNVLRNLQYKDAGGITLNHPAWTKASGAGYPNVLTNKDLLEMLDFDSRVLGIEFYNATAGDVIPGTSWDLDTWDYILNTGRRCWGFCVPDHDGENNTEGYRFRGRNVLLVNDFTEYECLKAYREGRFYGAIYNTDLKFSNIALNGHHLNATADNADYINVVVNGVYTRVDSDTVSFDVPSNAIYVRLEAHNEENSIFSNPIMFKVRENNSISKMMLLLNN